ncbi:linear amide C-N hydrolase [Dyella flagellata]|uniref:Choloylglycine hydrolase/NAAA C-terminal domain-containing protein n=1 Tax=Dyella flagellata TaxID=1867833 RepID=A0ABQ5XE89_9GAMM|nr:linear amide C-N hydrolase [Dyella flagellata]GLQ88956.1 hypothetical protein GCM10007898_25270 [Dyella flagellata]
MCTNMLFQAPLVPGKHERLHVSARVMELAGFDEAVIYKIPRNQSFPLTGGHETGLHKWINRYGFLGVAAPRPLFEKVSTFVDGINETGLSCAALWFAGVEYPKPSEEVPNLRVADFVGWVLGNFAKVIDLEDALAHHDKIHVFGPALDDRGLLDLELHFIATDHAGMSVVVEFAQGHMKVFGQAHEVYDKLHHRGLGATVGGVLTNTPSYDWQRTNLAQYSNLTPFGPVFGPGHSGSTYPAPAAGLVGLPGDPTSASRFVRAAVMQYAYSKLAKDGDQWLPAPWLHKNGKWVGYNYAEPVQALVNIALQAVQIVMGTPYGYLLANPKSSEPDAHPALGEWSNWTVVRDHTNKTLYYTDAFNSLLQAVDLGKLNFEESANKFDYPSIPLFPRMVPHKWYHDVTESLASDALASV